MAVKRKRSSQSRALTRMKTKGSKPVLPQDVITMILVRLPVKSLIRFQCVSKEWKNLFKTPSFIAEHLQHSTHQNPLLIFEDFDFHDRFRVRLLNREMRVRDVQTHPRINSRHSFVWAVNSCNGLICIVGWLHPTQSISICLWNPATRKLREVPARDYDLWVIVSLYVGFGFSPTLNDYKIVKIRMNNLWVINEVEVYSLNKRRWKEVELGSLDGVAVTSHGFTFNGAIFWIGSNLGGSILVSFDIATEVFTLIPMPPIRLWGTRTYSHKLTVYDNKLAMLFPERDSVHLWVMEEGSCASREKLRWTKKYASRTFEGPSLFPLTTIWRNEIVCNIRELGVDERPIVMWNVTTEEFKLLDIRKFGQTSFRGGIFNYVESLALIGN